MSFTFDYSAFTDALSVAPVSVPERPSWLPAQVQGNPEQIFMELLRLSRQSEKASKPEAWREYARYALDYARLWGVRQKLILGLHEYARAVQFANIPLALELFHEMCLLADQEDKPEPRAVAHGNYARLLMQNERQPEARQHALLSARLFREIQRDDQWALATITLMRTCMALLDYEAAISHAREVLSEFDTLKNSQTAALLLREMGQLLIEVHDYEDALRHFQMAMAIIDKADYYNTSIHVGCLNGMGTCCDLLNRKEEALGYYQQVYNISLEKKEIPNMAVAIGNIGFVYKSMGLYEQALDNFLKVKNLLKDFASPFAKLQTMVELADVYSLRGDIRLASEYLDKAAEINATVKHTESHSSLLRTRMRLAGLRGQYDTLIALSKEYAQHIENVQRTLSNKRIDTMRTWFETERLQREAAIYRQQNEELAIALDNQKKLNEELSRLNMEKNEFLGIAAHDLKNPLNAVLLLAQEIQSGRLNSNEVQEFSSDIIQSGQRMYKLITNLLDIEVLEQGRLKLNIGAVDIAFLLDICTRQYKEKALAKQITLHVHHQINPAFALVDEQACLQIADNLLSNAIKYSPPGLNIWLGTQCDEHYIHIFVRDEGPGISVDDQSRLFGKFQRLTARPTAGEDSNGLGLSIVKKLCEAMGGSVICKSSIGSGATFIASFPAAATQNRQQ
jgi:signal transduction histidine kinase